MFNFFRKSRPAGSGTKPDLSVIGTDMHSHLLPGIDDGSPDWKTSLELIRGMRELGYKKLITTPHIMWDMYRNERDDILRKADTLQTVAQKEFSDIEIKAAAEYFMDDHFSSLLDGKEPLLTLTGNMVLVEFSLAHRPMSLKDILFDMQLKGYQPVIAHPERYVYLETARDFYDDLRTIGCLFQLNLLSLSGYYGRSSVDLANYLIKKEYYDFVGTDLHNFRHLQALQDGLYNAGLRKLLDGGKLRNAELVD
jgi:protein-tyrosine phosphatase